MLFCLCRFYSCSHIKSCRYLSIDERITKQLPAGFKIPYVLFHKTGCTQQLVSEVFLRISKGDTFSAISRKLEEHNFGDFRKRLQELINDGLKLKNEELEKLTKRIFDDFQSMEMFQAPSSHLLEIIFMQEFASKRHHYTTLMHALSASRITVTTIDIESQLADSYKHIIVVLNEHSQVITWAFSRSSNLSDVSPMFNDLQTRLLSHGSRIARVTLNNCCEWRSFFQSRFAAEVKQDVNAAINRITNAVPKRGPSGLDRCCFERDLCRVFRSDGDVTSLPTPAPDVLSTNLSDFIRRWDAFGDSVFFGDECKALLRDLSTHVSYGCFSGVDPSDGTAEFSKLIHILHKGNDNFMSNTKLLRPQTALARLTVMFDSWNNSHMPLKAKESKLCTTNDASEGFAALLANGIVLPGSRYISTDFGYMNDTCKSDTDCSPQDGIPKSGQNDVSEIWRHAMSMQDVLVTDLAKLLLAEARDLHEVLQRIDKMTGQCTSLHLTHVQMHHVVCWLTVKSRDVAISETQHVQRLDKQLEHFHLQRDDSENDQRDLFTVVARQLMKHRQSTKPSQSSKDFECHLMSLCLNGSLAEQKSRLLELCIKELCGRKEEIMAKFTCVSSMEKYLEIIDLFRSQAASEYPELALRVVASILRCPVAAMTSRECVPAVLFMPERSIVKTPLFLAFACSSSGTSGSFFGVNRLVLPALTNAITDKLVNKTVCRCGCNTVSKDETIVTCTNIAGDDRMKYRTRCQCFKNGHGCVNCQCVNCGNEHNPSELLCRDHSLLNCRRCSRKRKDTKRSESSASKKQKQDDCNGQSSQKRTSDLEDVASANSTEPWTKQEQCLFEVVHSYLSSTTLEISPCNVSSLYNFVCTAMRKTCLKAGINCKAQDAIETELSQRNTMLAKSLKSVVLVERDRLHRSLAAKRDQSSVAESHVTEQEVASTAATHASLYTPRSTSTVALPSIDCISFQNHSHFESVSCHQSLQPQDMTYVAMSARQAELHQQVDVAAQPPSCGRPEDLTVRHTVVHNAPTFNESAPMSPSDYFASSIAQAQDMSTRLPVTSQCMSVPHAQTSTVGDQFLTDEPINATIGSTFQTLHNVPICKSMSLINDYQSFGDG